MPDFLPYLLIALAFLGLLAVVLEEVIHVNKAQVVLFLGALSWVLLFAFSSDTHTHELVQEGLQENIGEIASLWLFLLAAMTFVAYLNKKGLIESLIYRFLPRQVSERKLLIMAGLFSFVFSSLADNITATLISVALILSLNLSAAKTLRFATVVVFAVNSGGVAMITGDVTTLMIFLAGKVSITNLLLLSLPALTAVLLLAAMLSWSLRDHAIIQHKENDLARVDLAIAAIFILTILATIAGNVMFDIPPVLSFLTGLSVMFLVARAYGEDTENHPILNYIRQIEFDTLLFFLGILLIVGSLKEIHALDSFVALYQHMPAWAANYLMGLLSAVIDNVPLTAALLKADVTMTLQEWMALTYAVGVGGSLLIIGSAAGIVAMSKIDELTFGSYLKFFIALIIAYSVGYSSVLLLGHYVL
ncbi:MULTISPECIES: sodium:proton antiporter NhaD [Thalassolituus]|jgi:Na+/H+ antiporter NhaD/arsenite permease-like protein|uniref:sodium:proton antiporter NhaD n=1 Tax=Thalassolituus TaxID=187492 RepID=UPI000C561616|nr:MULTISPECIES: sodium:proton antiporter NhaD [Thalassolituus]MBU2097855.1 sodium:proton antiporter NhaD [Gammaproteobacteria bacterium]PIQ40675.1 MAG: sodium:proton antiporter [Thalassolituus sp. CG17_big_fil_post_rev_8_21_14_2_50_53_8]MCA6059413.1 sodium:proton antiporter NhaD [Thalassolituus sp. ST750PaO-4]MCB2386184.1 sodium:proton antiporter NhaD [Thalassolituus alkanivorans]MCB2422806.1 sodium:proton antiporter NhaD [Thalassolituus alkanivorans]